MWSLAASHPLSLLHFSAECQRRRLHTLPATAFYDALRVRTELPAPRRADAWTAAAAEALRLDGVHNAGAVAARMSAFLEQRAPLARAARPVEDPDWRQLAAELAAEHNASDEQLRVDWPTSLYRGVSL